LGHGIRDELDRQDPIAQAGRYPVDRKGNQTLTGLSIGDMGDVKKAVNKISRYLQTIDFHLVEGEPECKSANSSSFLRARAIRILLS
jgi:hypothetical protein